MSKWIIGGLITMIVAICASPDTVPGMFNLSTRRVGGIRFLRIGRITITLCVSRGYRPIKGA